MERNGVYTKWSPKVSIATDGGEMPSLGLEWSDAKAEGRRRGKDMKRTVAKPKEETAWQGFVLSENRETQKIKGTSSPCC